MREWGEEGKMEWGDVVLPAQCTLSGCLCDWVCGPTTVFSKVVLGIGWPTLQICLGIRRFLFVLRWKSPWCWGRLRAEGEDVRGWEGWMASLMQWTWTWANSGTWRGAGRPGVLPSVGLQRVRHDWGTEQQQQRRFLRQGAFSVLKPGPVSWWSLSTWFHLLVACVSEQSPCLNKGGFSHPHGAWGQAPGSWVSGERSS